MGNILEPALALLKTTPQRWIRRAGHDLMHTVQGERALMQPFIAGCGPWKPYFKDHAQGRKDGGAR